jgi:hypothetical protein
MMTLWIVIARSKIEGSIAVEADPLNPMCRCVSQHLPRDDFGKVIAGVVIHMVVFVERANDIRRDI